MYIKEFQIHYEFDNQKRNENHSQKHYEIPVVLPAPLIPPAPLPGVSLSLDSFSSPDSDCAGGPGGGGAAAAAVAAGGGRETARGGRAALLPAGRLAGLGAGRGAGEGGGGREAEFEFEAGRPGARPHLQYLAW